MDGFTPEQRDWMGHLIRLNVDRVEKPTLLNVHDVKLLKWEIETQRTVLDRITEGKPLEGEFILMARYMVAYADLHIEWYGRRLDDQTFRAEVLAAKKRLREELNNAKTHQGERVAQDVEAMVEATTAQAHEAI